MQSLKHCLWLRINPSNPIALVHDIGDYIPLCSQCPYLEFRNQFFKKLCIMHQNRVLQIKKKTIKITNLYTYTLKCEIEDFFLCLCPTQGSKYRRYLPIYRRYIVFKSR